MAPYARLAGRALYAGLVTALTQVQASTGEVIWRAVVVAAALAAAEVLTPLNSAVGVGKK